MPVEQSFNVYVGDPWTIGLACFNGVTQQPQSLAGYAADFSLRANFGDASALISCTSSAPSANGSTISILPYTGTPGLGVVCVVTPYIKPADTIAAGVSIVSGAKMSRLWGQIRVIPPGSDPVTIALVSWYLRTKV